MISASGKKKATKQAARYEPVAMGKDHCSLCEYFEQEAPRHCLKVQGIIAPGAWCKFFDHK